MEKLSIMKKGLLKLTRIADSESIAILAVVEERLQETSVGIHSFVQGLNDKLEEISPNRNIGFLKANDSYTQTLMDCIGTHVYEQFVAVVGELFCQETHINSDLFSCPYYKLNPIIQAVKNGYIETAIEQLSELDMMEGSFAADYTDLYKLYYDRGALALKIKREFTDRLAKKHEIPNSIFLQFLVDVALGKELVVPSDFVCPGCDRSMIDYDLLPFVHLLKKCVHLVCSYCMVFESRREGEDWVYTCPVCGTDNKREECQNLPANDNM